MQQVVIINGYETVIEIPESQVVPPVKVDGNSDSYRIDYGNGLVKVGGELTIKTVPVKDGAGRTEGMVTVDLPEFRQVLGFGVVAMDSDKGSLFEHAHLGQVTFKDMNVYASAISDKAVELKVNWFVEGII